SLYDALYGTDIIPEDAGAEKGSSYNPVRGNKVIAYASAFLDQACPLANDHSHADVVAYRCANGQLTVTMEGGESLGLKRPEQFIAYQGDAGSPKAILLKNNGLHIEIQVDSGHPIGKTQKAGVK